MGVKITREATCDRCRNECCGSNNSYHYSTITIKEYDSRVNGELEGSHEIVLCGSCLSKFGDWLSCLELEEVPTIAKKECEIMLYSIGHILVEGKTIGMGVNPNIEYGGIWQKGKRMFEDGMRNFWIRIK